MARNNSREFINRKQITGAGNTGEFSLECLLKHPLENCWTLWYYHPDRNKPWEDCQCEIARFNSVEEFWGLYHHILPASELKNGCDYSLFKQAIPPMWEADQNKYGGRWVINIDKKQQQDLDDLWLETLLCLIGESFNLCSDDICGAVVGARPKGYKISVWTSNAESRDNVMEIGFKLKERLRIVNKIVYQAHEDTMIAKNKKVTSRFSL